MEIDLKSARKGLTQAQAAERCGVSLRTWQSWEASGAVPDNKRVKLDALTTPTQTAPTSPKAPPKALSPLQSRQALNLTQMQAATRCGVSARTWQAWEASGDYPNSARAKAVTAMTPNSVEFPTWELATDPVQRAKVAAYEKAWGPTSTKILPTPLFTCYNADGTVERSDENGVWHPVIKPPPEPDPEELAAGAWLAEMEKAGKVDDSEFNAELKKAKASGLI